MALALLSLLGVHASAQDLKTTSTGYTQFPPSDVRVVPPGLDDCFISVDMWPPGSYFAGGGEVVPPGTPIFRRKPIRPPTTPPLAPGTSRHAIAQMVQGVLVQMLSSRDMRNKVSNGCTVIGGPIAVRLLHGDPNVLGGSVVKGTNLVLIDLADVDAHVKSATAVAPPGTSPEAIANAIATASFGYLIAILAHELDHLRETGKGPFAGAHADPGQGAPAGDLTGGAVRDESLVLNELGVRSFREFYSVVHNGKPVIQYDVNGIKVNVDPFATPAANASSSNERRFVDSDPELLGEIEDRCCGCDNAACPASPDTTQDNAQLQRLHELEKEYGFDGSLYLNYDLGTFRIEAEPPRVRANPDDVEAVLRVAREGSAPVDQPEPIQSAPKQDDTQVMGASAVLKYANTPVVVARNETSQRGGVARFFSRQAIPSPWAARSHELRFEQRAGRTPPMTAVFRSLGRSSGSAFQMEIVNGTQESLAALGAGFLLEPVAKVRRQDAERQLARIKGRRQSIAIDAYCMEFMKAPPVLDMIYRIMPRDGAKKFRAVGPIMLSSKRLLEAGFLRPDSDPEEYFHSIRQWAIWSEEQGWKTQDAFGNALLAHTKKNYEAAKRAWTPQVEAAIKRVIPGRWRDIESVLAERDILLMRYRKQ